MSEIREWLEALGLERYAEAFEENEITLDYARDLTDADLKDLGVATMGHRKALQRAIDALTVPPPDTSPAAVELAPSQTPPPLAAKGGREAERRQLTVMFCDLVGSTALSEAMDPEDLRALMAAYRQAADEVIGRYDGHVAQYLGDGLMVYFGWPLAHEDDAERSVRAGLEILDAVKRVEAPQPLQVRVGIATGQVVVGEGADDAQANRLAVGETPNLAARLQGLAGPDEIVIGPGTHRLVGGAFDYEDLGARNLKGIVDPVPAWRVSGASAAEGRFEAQTTGGLTPLVGRGPELALLMERWERAKDGEGQVVLLSGEPGIGKSRVTQVLRERLADEPHARLRYQCSPFHANSAFYPIIDQLERAAGFARDDSAEGKLDKLEALLADGPDGMETVALLVASMMSLPVDRYPPHDLSPQRQKDDTMAALAAQVTALAERRPVLMLFEDAHWSDPTTLETLTAVIGQIEAAPVLLVITYRPEFDPPWSGHGHVVTQRLSRLGKRQGAEMIAKVTGGKPLPDIVLDQIVAKTDGVPLFVEELTKTVLEAGFLKQDDNGFMLEGPLPALAIPSTLQDSLMARLDRLSPVKEVAQIGACIGRAFSHELLSAVSPLRDNELKEALQKLVNSELIFQTGSPTATNYTFKHALVQDAAYDSLLKSKRQELHGQIAEAMQDVAPSIVNTEPEIIAAHMTNAGLIEQAIPMWIRAGRQSMDRMALAEAIAQLSAGISALGGVPSSRQRDSLEVELRYLKGSAIMGLRGYSDAEIETTLAPAKILAIDTANAEALVPILWGLFLYSNSRGEFAEAVKRAEEAVQLTRDHADGKYAIFGIQCLAVVYFWKGDNLLAKEYTEKTLGMYNESEHGHFADLLNYEMRTNMLSFRSSYLWEFGWPDKARQAANDCMSWAKHVRNPVTLCWAYTIGGIAYELCGDWDQYQEFCKQAQDVADEQGLVFLSQQFIPMRWGASSIDHVDPQYSIEAMQRYDLRVNAAAPNLLALLAYSLSKLGKHSAADKTISEAMQILELNDSRIREPEILRISGVIAEASPNKGAAEAEDWYIRSLQCAQRKRTKSWELRTAMSLARLWKSQGKIEEAHDLLAPIYGWFTEGFGTADLKDAKALLDELK